MTSFLTSNILERMIDNYQLIKALRDNFENKRLNEIKKLKRRSFIRSLMVRVAPWSGSRANKSGARASVYPAPPPRKESMEAAMDMIKHHEGCRLKAYKDTVGVPTIGYGRNLEKGISQDEAELMFKNDFNEALIECYEAITTFSDHNEARRTVLVNMMFNLGRSRLLNFKKMLGALAVKDYDRAAAEMLDSKWAQQVGNRSLELAKIMKEGKL